MILILNYNINYLPALIIFEGVSEVKFNKRKPLHYIFVTNSHVGYFPTRHQIHAALA